MHTDDIDMNNVVVVYMTSTTITSRIDEDAPQLPFAITNNPEAKQQIMYSIKRSAYQYDIYNDIIQLSFLWNNMFVHNLFCGTLKSTIVEPSNEHRIITVANTEQDMLRNAAAYINSVYQETADGIPCTPKLFAGWKLTSINWPHLINKMFAYDIPLPTSLYANLLYKYPRTDILLDLSNIYTQSSTAYMRHLPALADALKYWGYRGTQTKDRYALPETIIKNVCDAPITAACDVEVYMKDMYDVLCRYYRKGNNER